ncbi:IPT/TIG domain-containing protein [Trichocoleus desertorum AS-A10]|uniref:IPT/TIG domain-containing protein n=1 Tax=Trichocoleus desertorum TaxID=1481672 RepID=UPI003296E714
MTNSDRPLTPNEPPALPNDEWELSELIQVITAELDQAQDTLILKSQNRRLSMMVNQLNLDLQVDVRRDPTGHLMFRTVAPGQTGATVLKLGFTPALDTQVQETRKSIDLETGDYRRLEDLTEIQSVEIQKLKTVGIHSVNDLEVATQTPAMLTEISVKSGLDEARLRLWRELPLITQIKPESGAPGSIVVIDGANFGARIDAVEVYFQDKLAKVLDCTNTRITVEMPRNLVGGGFLAAKIGNQKTNTLPWRADTVDLNVQDIMIDSPTPIVQGQEVTFRAILSNQGNVDAAGFEVSWELLQVGVTRLPLPDRTAPTMLQALVDDSDDIQGPSTQSIYRELYSHGSLRSLQQSSDNAVTFKYKFDQPGIYRISFMADPNKQTFDQLQTNNQFIREFAVNALPPPPPPPPPVPLLNPSPNQFAPRSGKAGDTVTLFGRNLNVGTVSIRFGTVAASIVGAPTATQIVVRVPTFSRGGNVPITVQTGGGTVSSTDVFSVVVPVYYGSGTAIGGNLL